MTIFRSESCKPGCVQFSWRFLGISPRNTISLRFKQRGKLTDVTVLDEDPDRSDTAVREQAEGWRDFTTRLVHYLSTGKNSRYEWRSEFEASIELPCSPSDAWNVLLREQTNWLPLDRPLLESGGHLVLVDGSEPSEFDVSNVDVNKHHIEFHLQTTSRDVVTRCELELSHRGTGTLLSVQHSGWKDNVNDIVESRRQRQRFSPVWIQALQRASTLCRRISLAETIV